MPTPQGSQPRFARPLGIDFSAAPFGFRWCRCAQPPANGFDPCGGRFPPELNLLRKCALVVLPKFPTPSGRSYAFPTSSCVTYEKLCDFRRTQCSSVRRAGLGPPASLLWCYMWVCKTQGGWASIINCVVRSTMRATPHSGADRLKSITNPPAVGGCCTYTYAYSRRPCWGNSG